MHARHGFLRLHRLGSCALAGPHRAISASGPAHADNEYVPHHVTATSVDTFGNGRPGGRYFLVPGSSGRAADIAKMLDDVEVRPSDRGHNVHLGKLDGQIDVGVVSSGMGCPSVDIILKRGGMPSRS